MEKTKLLFLLVAVLIGSYYTAEIKQGPSNAISLFQREVFFNCTVSLDYPIIIWLLNGSPVLTIANNHPIITDERFGSRNYTSELGYTAELIIFSLELNDRGNVMCSIQSDSRTASLDVQVNGSLRVTSASLNASKNTPAAVVCEASGWLPSPEMTWLTNGSNTDPNNSVIQIIKRDDGLYDTVNTLTITANYTTVITCMAIVEALASPQSVTVTLIITAAPVNRSSVIIIAVTGSITGILVLILIIGAIVYCVQQFRQPRSTYQEEVRKASSKKKAASTYAGQDNPGFCCNDSSLNFHSGYSISSSKDSNIYYYRNKEVDNIDTSQVPDVVQKTETFQRASQTSSSLNVHHYPANPQKIRHITAV